MIFRRKNQIDISIENSKDLPNDTDFSSLSDVNIKTGDTKVKVKSFIKENATSFKDDIFAFAKNTNTYIKDNKFSIWNNCFSFFSLFMLVFTIVMATWPFSYAAINNYYTPLTNFYVYDYTHLSLSLSGFIFIIFLIIWLVLSIIHFCFCIKKKINNDKYDQYFSQKRIKVFKIVRIIAWSLFATTVFIFLLLILIPPTIDISELNNQALYNKVASLVQSGNEALLTEVEKKNFLTMMGIDFSSQTANIDQLVKDAIKIGSPDSISDLNLIFYNVSFGGISSLNILGLVLISFASFFGISSLILFASRIINNLLNSNNLSKFKKQNVQFNFNDVRENISSINNKIRGVYNTSQQKYQEYKTKDTFRKYKKRLVEEGKDTNPDKFTTDVEQPNNQEPKETLFSALKTVYKSKVKKHDLSEKYNNTEKDRMKYKKPEIAVPDEELDELIDSLDIE